VHIIVKTDAEVEAYREEAEKIDKQVKRQTAALRAALARIATLETAVQNLLNGIDKGQERIGAGREERLRKAMENKP